MLEICQGVVTFRNGISIEVRFSDGGLSVTSHAEPSSPTPPAQVENKEAEVLGMASDEVSEISTPKGVALATVELEEAEGEGQPLRKFTVIKRGPAEGEVCCCVCCQPKVKF